MALKTTPAILVAKATSIEMNSTLSAEWIAKQIARDPSRARAEYEAVFRSDIETYVSIEAVEACIDERNRFERAPIPNTHYFAFVDAAGGSGKDSMTLAISHRDKQSIVLDLLREVRPPFSPTAVVEEFVSVLDTYRIHSVTGDRYGGEFVREQFKTRSVKYVESERTKSDLYKELLPLINTQTIDLLDNQRLVAQLCSLECRTARGTGRDSIDAPRDMHEDLANAAAGALVIASAKKRGVIVTDEILNAARLDAFRMRAGGAW